jgi:hypothetical protein
MCYYREIALAPYTLVKTNGHGLFRPNQGETIMAVALENKTFEDATDALDWEMEQELEQEKRRQEEEEESATFKDIELEWMEWELESMRIEAEIEQENAWFDTEMEIDEFEFSALMEELEELERSWSKREKVAYLKRKNRRELASLTKKSRRANRRDRKAKAQKRAEDICLRHHPLSPIVKEDGWRFTTITKKWTSQWGEECEYTQVVQIPEEKPSRRRWLADIDSISGRICGTPTGVWNARKRISHDTREYQEDINLDFGDAGRRPILSASAAICQSASGDVENFAETQHAFDEKYLDECDKFCQQQILRRYEDDIEEAGDRIKETTISGKGWHWIIR